MLSDDKEIHEKGKIYDANIFTQDTGSAYENGAAYLHTPSDTESSQAAKFSFTRVCSECYDLRIKLIETKRCDGAAQRKTRKVKLSVRRDLIDNASRKITLLLTSHILQIQFEV